LAGGDTNLYAYVGNDPVNHLDPRGADSDDDTLAPLGPAPAPDPLPTLAPVSFDHPAPAPAASARNNPYDPFWLAPLVPPRRPITRK